MDSGKQRVGLLAASSDDPLPMDVASGFKPQVRRQAVGNHRAPRSDALLYEGEEAVGRRVADDGQPDSANTG